MKSFGMSFPSRVSMKSRADSDRNGEGFSLIEMMVAMLILAFGLLAAGQMIYVAMSSAALARSKGNVTVVAQDKLEFLSDLYARDPAAPELTLGDHGPEMVQVVNPTDNTTVNRFEVTWKVLVVNDPRAGKVLQASQVRVTVKPVGTGGADNYKAYANKSAVVEGIFSPRS